METALYILHILVCLAMLPIILLQSGKGGGVIAEEPPGSEQLPHPHDHRRKVERLYGQSRKARQPSFYGFSVAVS
ncbi:MAG: preprotein translocase subunit SecG, partial [Myxococcota bacterium]